MRRLQQGSHFTAAHLYQATRTARPLVVKVHFQLDIPDCSWCEEHWWKEVSAEVAAGVTFYGSTSVSSHQDSHASTPTPAATAGMLREDLQHIVLTLAVAVSDVINPCS